MQRLLIGVIGASRATARGCDRARQVGRLIALGGAVLVCGGLGGVMTAACQGACEVGGETLGLLPGGDPCEANPFVTLAVPTNMGHARNIIIAHTARALIAIEGEYGTLAEMAIALKLGRPVIALDSWPSLPGIIHAGSAEEAVQLAFARLGKCH